LTVFILVLAILFGIYVVARQWVDWRKQTHIARRLFAIFLGCLTIVFSLVPALIGFVFLGFGIQHLLSEPLTAIAFMVFGAVVIAATYGVLH